MDHSERPALICKQIAHMENHNAFRRHRHRHDPHPKHDETKRRLEAKNADLPPLPPWLPRPEYAATANLVSQDEKEIDFYAACEQGHLEDVTRFIEEQNPSQGVRQYGLEQASFGNQATIARYLLKQGTILHVNVFERSCPYPEHPEKLGGKAVSIFDKDRLQDPLELLKVFVEFGWHPNQAWIDPLGEQGHVVLQRPSCVANRPLVTFLLEHGADPNLGDSTYGEHGVYPLCRRCGHLANMAVGQYDPSLIDLLLAHGAQPAYSRLLHRIACFQGDQDTHLWETVPFARRRPLAEHLLPLSVVDVNEVRSIDRHLLAAPPGWGEDETPLSYACAAQDWEFAEWLLDNGADPGVVGGKAFQPRSWCLPYLEPCDPQVLADFWKRMRSQDAGVLEESSNAEKYSR
jgi:ankyrin repeat protein